MARCRDCVRCTESSFKKLASAPFRATVSPLRATTGFFRKKCRQCGHLIAEHEIVDNRFKD